jgi:hypothetical protein
MDSFGCVYVDSGEEEKIVLLCGYDGRNAECLNSVYSYSITKNRVSTLFKGTRPEESPSLQDQSVPIPRSGCAVATDGKTVYMFGGKDAQNRMNDLWQFSLEEREYRKMAAQGTIPP